jgi:DNA modification methylase
MNICINGDVVNELKNIKSNSIDFILIDPPYGTTASYWDKIVNFDFLWGEFNRIGTKNYICASFSAQPFTTLLINSNLKNFKYCWYWIKNQGTNFLHAKTQPIRKVEEICIFGGKKYIPQKTTGHQPTNSSKGSSNGKCYHGINKRNYSGGSTERFPTNILDFKCVNNYARKHPNQKPIELCEYLIKTYTDKNSTVMDCFFGSGSTLTACINLKRNFIGIEKDLNYFNEFMANHITDNNIVFL